MLEYACQRIYRDARITSIYEGTTQLQTVAAIRYVTSGFYSNVLNDYLQEEVAPEFAGLKSTAAAMVKKYEEAVAKVNAAENDELHDFLARRLYEMAADCIMSLLIIRMPATVLTSSLRALTYTYASQKAKSRSTTTTL